jgi:hypothetical protein
VAEVTYWFRATNSHPEWLRQTGAAIGCAAAVVPWDDPDFRRASWVEIYVGSVNSNRPRVGAVTEEVVSFRAASRGTIDSVDGALRSLGSSRAVKVTREDPSIREALARFAFLYEGALLRFGWWGPSNEQSFGTYTGLRVMCPRDEREDAELVSAFSSPDAVARLSAFYARAVGRPGRTRSLLP